MSTFALLQLGKPYDYRCGYTMEIVQMKKKGMTIESVLTAMAACEELLKT
jgi:hypothetical protein